jgi:outer membrane protein assembly factor BamB
VLAILGAPPTPGWAQPGAFSGPETRFKLSSTVQLDRADSDVQKALDQVKAHLAAGQWGEAVEALIRTMESSGNKLLGVTDRRLVSIRDYCHLQLASLPPEARAIYRRRVDPLAKKWYDEGAAQRDSRLLGQVVSQAFASSWGDDALLALGEIALESGDYAAARAYWEKIIPVDPPADQSRTWLSVPETDLDLAAVRARLVLASVLEGSTARARDELSQFVRLHAGARGRLGGVEVNYAEALTRLLAESASWPRPPIGPDWPTFAGSPLRNKTATEMVDLAQVAWRAKLPAAPGADRSIWGAAAPGRRAADDARTPLSYHPVVVDDLVFVGSQTEVLAYGLRTGRPAWGHESAAIYRDHLDRPAQSAYNPPNTLGTPRFTLTVQGNKLFARMGSAATGQPRQQAAGARNSYLVCLDLKAEGRLAFPRLVAEEGWTYEGTPVCDGASFYVAMRRHEVQPQLHVGCFDSETGQLRWRQFVSAADTPAGSFLLENTNNLLTLHRETLYYNTNAGAVAALSVHDGRPLWVSLYPRAQEGDLLKPEPHWDRDLVPCLYDRGTLLVAPADSRRVFAIEAATGQILWQSGPETGDVVHLLGVSGDRLIAGGNRLYWLALSGPDRGKVKALWPDGQEKLGYGRGILAGDCVAWPTRDKIYVFDAATGRLRKDIDLAPRGAAGGNLLIAGDRLLIASGAELVCFSQQGQTPKEKEVAAVLGP